MHISHSHCQNVSGSDATSLQQSLPGTPQSISSVRHHNNNDNEHSEQTTSDRNSNKFPDIVEDTQPSLYSVLNEPQTSGANTEEEEEEEHMERHPDSHVTNQNANEDYNVDGQSNVLSNVSNGDSPSQQNYIDNFAPQSPLSVNLNRHTTSSDVKNDEVYSNKCNRIPEANRDHVLNSPQSQEPTGDITKNNDIDVSTTNNCHKQSKSKDHMRLTYANRGLSQDSFQVPADIKRTDHATLSMSDTETEQNDTDLSIQSHSVPNLAETSDNFTIRERKRTLSKGASESEIHKGITDKQRLLRGRQYFFNENENAICLI